MASKRNGILWVKGLEDRKEVGTLGRLLKIDYRIACYLCMRFWAWADDHTQDGFIPNTDTAFVDSKLGQPGFCDAMTSVGWLEIEGDGIRLPRWNKYRACVFFRRQSNTERQSRLRAKRDAKRDKGATRSATKARQICEPKIAKKPAKMTIPTPNDTSQKVVGGVGGGARASIQDQPKHESAPADSERDQTLREQAEQVFAHYRTLHPQAHRIPMNAANEWRAVSGRLKEGFSVADLIAAIDGCHRCPHNQGHNERGMKYLGLELICRNGSQVTRFMEIPHDALNGPHFSERTRETIRGAEGYLSQRQSGVTTNGVH